MSKYPEIGFFMNTREEINPGWLDLSLGQDLGGTCSQSRETCVKVYACNFCNRKFYSSQALGGHQNAHRRDRDTRRRYQEPKMMNLSMSSTENLSLGVHAHSFVHSPKKDDESTVSTFTNNGASYGAVWMQNYVVEEAVHENWPGGVYLDPQPASLPSDPLMLDLNLRL